MTPAESDDRDRMAYVLDALLAITAIVLHNDERAAEDIAERELRHAAKRPPVRFGEVNPWWHRRIA